MVASNLDLLELKRDDYLMCTMPRRIATLTAAVRSPTFNFAKMFLRCTWTVSSLMPSSTAISLLRRLATPAP